MSEEIDYSNLEPIQIPVKVGKKQYILREASGDAHVQWRNAIDAATVYNEDGKRSGYKNLADVEPFLVSLCLVEIGENGAVSAVTANEVRGWPQRVIKRLHDKVNEISEFNDDETEASLNKQLADINRKLAKFKKNGSVEKKELINSATGSS